MTLDIIKQSIKEELFNIIKEIACCYNDSDINNPDFYSDFFSQIQQAKKTLFRDLNFFDSFSTIFIKENHENKIPEFKPYSYLLSTAILKSDFNLLYKDNEEFRIFSNSLSLLKNQKFMVNFKFLSALKKLIIFFDKKNNTQTDLFDFFSQISTHEAENLEFYFESIMAFTNKKSPDIYELISDIKMHICSELFFFLIKQQQKTLKLNRNERNYFKAEINDIKSKKYIIEKLKERKTISKNELVSSFSGDISDSIKNNKIEENLSCEIISSSLAKNKLEYMFTPAIFSKSTFFNNNNEVNLFCFILTLDFIVKNIEHYNSKKLYNRIGIFREAPIDNDALKKIFIEEQIRQHPEIRFITPLYNKSYPLSEKTTDQIINYFALQNINNIFQFLEEKTIHYNNDNKLFYMSEKYKISSIIHIIENYGVDFFSIYSESISDYFLSHIINIDDISSDFISTDLFKNAIKETQKNIFEQIQSKIQSIDNDKNTERDILLKRFIDSL